MGTVPRGEPLHLKTKPRVLTAHLQGRNRGTEKVLEGVHRLIVVSPAVAPVPRRNVAGYPDERKGVDALGCCAFVAGGAGWTRAAPEAAKCPSEGLGGLRRPLDVLGRADFKHQ